MTLHGSLAVKLRITSLLTVCAAAGLAVVATGAHAVVTSNWMVETYSQFDQGDATAAFINSLGEVRPGWDSTRTAVESDAVWSSVRLSDGTILLGSDSKGSIVRVNGKDSKKLVSIDGAIAVVALAQAADGTVYASTMPGNKLYKIDVAAAKATVVATLPAKDAETIWSLAVASNGTVYAGVGPSGKLFAINGGTAKEIFATGDKRVTAITVDNKTNAVWFGTSERALVFRYDGKSTRAVADFAGNEISAIALGGNRGGVIIAANELQDPPTGPGKNASTVEAGEKPNAAKGTPAKTPDAGSKPGADKDAPSVSDTGRRGAKKGKGALFAVADDGRLKQLHALTQTYFTAVTLDADGNIFAAAADKGRIYMVDNEQTVATAFDVDERAVSQLVWDGKTLVFATDDAAALYRAGGRASKASYVSDVFDGKGSTQYGRLAYQAQGGVTVETRSGNTAKPGPGWSEWQALSGDAASGPSTLGGRSGKIASPVGRYLQFRAALKDERASLRRVSLYYLPQNNATTIEEVTVEAASKETLPTLKDFAGKARSPLQRVKWKIDNQDSDETVYTLDVRRDGETNWRPLATGKTPLTATSWEWNTETFPDGWYRLRVSSTDASANSLDRAMTASATSSMFSIDNQRPTIEALKVDGNQASARATDSLNIVTEMAFSIDDGPWQLGACGDGIFDDQSETLRIDLPASLSKGTHTLALRVADAAGNVAATSTSFVK
jgi:hypothetical protein